ncbi:uncharacterized protein LOC117301644 [Asterias rubens]|uniref:uncharacterized protein LOC117301644 n=1 Tax=Asterias rubens TaxID=7604 RepID=UPI0014558160|nr:uncharacterized protein LOC117301644 [Asterias rubens]XP_033641555.1 uncharacterized protein LOC117301644 [Asterias rubens]XP_033641556.1 uncharacterized protein LOC117301644 [Asterias rubens]
MELHVLELLLPVFVILFVYYDAVCGIEFPKDQREVEFPPNVPKQRASSTVPIGHLRPFGYQRKPEGRVFEYNEFLHPAQFHESHVSKKKPVVFRKAVLESPALRKWTDEYLLERYGDLDVIVERKKENREVRPKRMKFAEFLKRYQTESFYIVSLIPQEMSHEVKVHESLLCGTFKRRLLETNLWMSSGGTASLIHYDADHNVHCLLAGRKDFIMIDPKYSHELRIDDPHLMTGSGFSKLDVDQINLFQNRDVANVPWRWTTLKPGDCIFIPGGYLHQVRSYSRSISATILFASAPTFDKSDCENATFEYTDLTQVRVMWTYKKGDKLIEVGYMDAERIRDDLISLLRETDKLSAHQFGLFFKGITHEDDEEVAAEMENIPIEAYEIFALFDTQSKGFITRKEIEDMDIETLKDFARILDQPTVPYEPTDVEHDEL